MTRVFILTRPFEATWKSLGCDDIELASLQDSLCSNPRAGAVVQGTGGLRKMRIPLADRGKSGGARVLYVDFPSQKKIYLFGAYPKNEKEDLTQEEKQHIKQLVLLAELEVAKGGARR